MKKAVISSGGKQYLVAEGDSLEVELLASPKKTLEFAPLLLIDDAKTEVGKPDVSGSKVTASVEQETKLTEKVTSIRYKSKKRVHKVRGHRQQKTVIKITKIS